MNRRLSLIAAALLFTVAGGGCGRTALVGVDGGGVGGGVGGGGVGGGTGADGGGFSLEVVSGGGRVTGGGRVMTVEFGHPIGQAPTTAGNFVIQGNAAIKR